MNPRRDASFPHGNAMRLLLTFGLFLHFGHALEPDRALVHDVAWAIFNLRFRVVGDCVLAKDAKELALVLAIENPTKAPITFPYYEDASQHLRLWQGAYIPHRTGAPMCEPVKGTTVIPAGTTVMLAFTMHLATWYDVPAGNYEFDLRYDLRLDDDFCKQRSNWPRGASPWISWIAMTPLRIE